jgi:hypothetical protein
MLAGVVKIKNLTGRRQTIIDNIPNPRSPIAYHINMLRLIQRIFQR